MGDYTPLLILMAVAAIICAAMVSLSWLLGPKKNTPYKSSPYECGVTPAGRANERIPIKFYLVAILFVLFDIEVVFLWSWLTVFKNGSLEFKLFTGAIVGIYMLLWIIGDAYVIRIGALDWDEADSLAPEKLQSSSLPRLPEPEPGVRPAITGGQA
ncbi:MAG: NADH-quinone oxidoreductase subunit A [Fimbriimonadaceae bacterium]|nr:NADH-quinone oxidoreductase subunit A [Fimbriimonadaceae bacterium]QYK57058.1 MAG: NADH-quinone oxidoreductase subunit A [Fimbriimonadaceae bacterium]